MSPLRGAGPVADGPGATGRDGAAGAGPAGTAGYDTTWLDLRGAADARSRSVDLLDRLAGAVRQRGAQAPHLLDVGCGAGAMARWCAARWPGPSAWTLVDPDPRLLAVAQERAAHDGLRGPGASSGAGPRTLVGTVADLPRLLRGDGPPVDGVVASALVDVLDGDAVAGLVGAVAAARVPLLVALTVTGEVALDPPHPDDADARRAVDREATRGGASGPDGVRLLLAAAAGAGLQVATAGTPWRLRPPADRALVEAWTDGYVAAALAGTEQPDRLGGWAGRRRRQAAAGELAVVVDHTDVLVLPAEA